MTRLKDIAFSKTAICSATTMFWFSIVSTLIMPPGELLKWVLWPDSIEDRLDLIYEYDAAKKELQEVVQQSFLDKEKSIQALKKSQEDIKEIKQESSVAIKDLERENTRVKSDLQVLKDRERSQEELLEQAKNRNRLNLEVSELIAEKTKLKEEKGVIKDELSQLKTDKSEEYNRIKNSARQEAYDKITRSIEETNEASMTLPFKSAFEIREPVCAFEERMLCAYIYMTVDKKFKVVFLTQDSESGIISQEMLAQVGAESIVENQLIRYRIKCTDIGSLWQLDPVRKIRLQIVREQKGI